MNTRLFTNRLQVLICLAVFFQVACNNNKKKLPADNQQENKTTADNDSFTKTWEYKTEKLEELQPCSPDSLAGLLPGELAGAPASGISSNNDMGASFAKSEYIPNDSVTFKLSVYDCAGAEGAGILNRQFVSMLNTNDEKNTRIIDFKGSKAIEYFDPEDREGRITYFTGRFLVSLEGKILSADELKRVAREIRLKN